METSSFAACLAGPEIRVGQAVCVACVHAVTNQVSMCAIYDDYDGVWRMLMKSTQTYAACTHLCTQYEYLTLLALLKHHPDADRKVRLHLVPVAVLNLPSMLLNLRTVPRAISMLQHAPHSIVPAVAHSM